MKGLTTMSDQVKIPLPRSLQEIVGSLLFASQDHLTATELRGAVRVDLRTGEIETEVTNALVIGKREFDPAWNLVKIVRRGFGEIGEAVEKDEERVRFDIRIR